MTEEIIVTHTATDLDAFASCLGAKKIYPGAEICFPGPVTREVNLFLTLYPEVLKPKKSEELNLKEIKRLILVDTRWINRVGIFRRLIEEKKVELHVYDHHPPSPQDIKGEKEVCQEVGSTSTLISQLIRKRKISLSPWEASVLLIGIYEDTGSLTFSTTTPLDLEISGWLLSQGGSLELVTSFINMHLSPRQYTFFQKLLEKVKEKEIRGIEVVIIPVEVEDFVGGLSHPLHKLIDLKNIEIVFALVRTKKGTYLIARSRNPRVNVAEILSFFGGGGHNFAASAFLKERELKKVERELLEVLEERLRPGLLVKDVMSSPVVYASLSTPAREAKKIMEKYKITALPVLSGGKVVGMVNRERVENLILSSGERAPLKGSLSPYFATVSPFASLKKAQELMIENETSRLLVLSEGKPVGIVTGKDLLKAFHRQGKEKDPSLESFLGEALPEKVVELLKEAGEIAEKEGFKLYLVGGIVRDLLLGARNLDVDLLVEGNGVGFAKILSRVWETELKTYPRFGTSTLTFPSGFRVDITTARKEFYPQKGALPQVEPASFEEDLARRDFTINSLAISLNPSSWGKLFDPFGGKKDLEKGVIRILTKESFLEDPLRILRALRYQVRFGFRMSPGTERAFREAVRKRILEKVTRERIRDEFLRILEEERPFPVLVSLKRRGVLSQIHPSFRLGRRERETFSRLVDVLGWYGVLTGEEVKGWIVWLLALLYWLREEEVKDFLENYHFSREVKEITFMVKRKGPLFLKKIKSPRKLSPSEIYEIFSPFPREGNLFLLSLTLSKLARKRAYLYFTQLREVKIFLEGKDLEKLGYPPSPLYSRIFSRIKKEKLEGRVKTKEEEIELVKKNFPRRKNWKA